MKKSIFVSTLVAATALAVPAFADELTWTGSSGSDWTGTGNWSSSDWSDGSDAVFGSGTATVTVTGTVTAGSVTIQDGGSYTFNIGTDATLTTGTLTNSGSLALTGSGTIVTGASSNGTYLAFNATSFTGNLTFTEGFFDVAGSTLNSNMTVTITANTTGTDSTGILSATDVSIHLGHANESTNTEFAANLVLDGDGGVIIRTHATTKTITFSGSVTGETATLQANGGGSVVFAGTVNLGTYIAYQGATTFSGSSTELGTLEFASDNGTASSVVFTTGASVTSLTTEAASAEFTDLLTVSNGATLTVGSVSLSSTGSIEVTTTGEGSTFTVTGNVTTSGGTLSIASGSTLTATGATGTTIQGIAGEGTLKLESSTTSTQFTVVTDDSFAGTVNLVEGYLQLNGTSIASSASLVLQAAGTASSDSSSTYYTGTALASIHFGVDGVSLANDITVEGEGGVLIRSNGVSGTLSGNISGESAAYLQLNGGGSVTISGSVTLENGGYLNYQGSTTFTNAVTLGTLEITQDSTTTSKVTFSGENAQATVGTLTFENHGSGDANSEGLTVQNGAKLTVTDALTINHDITITLDAGTLDIQGSVSGDKSASITISNGGTLNVGSSVTLNSATIEIVLGTDDVASTNGISLTAAGSAILTGSGTLGSDVSITITVDEALANLLESGGEYTFNIYDSTLTISGTFDLSAFDQYGTASIDNGVLSVTVGAIPEPSMFGLFFGLGAIGLVATRRRRRA